MNLRPAVLSDCPTLAAIDAQGNPSSWTAQQFESAVQHHPDSVWLSQTNHQITGFIVWQTVFDESELHLIAVAPEYRRQGIASALLQHWQNAVQQQDATRLLLEVRASNETAQQLYRKHGFQTCGRRKNYYALPDGGSEDAVLMEKSC